MLNRAKGFWASGQQTESPINASVFHKSFDLCWSQFCFSLSSDSGVQLLDDIKWHDINSWHPWWAYSVLFCILWTCFICFFGKRCFLKIWAQIQLNGRNYSLLACSETIMQKPDYEGLWGGTKTSNISSLHVTRWKQISHFFPASLSHTSQGQWVVAPTGISIHPSSTWGWNTAR